MLPDRIEAMEISRSVRKIWALTTWSGDDPAAVKVCLRFSRMWLFGARCSEP
jgi:hypothetical protein